MINKLTYSVTFPTNQVSLFGDLSLQPGLTAVTGRNGSGKTFAASELIRYMLYGKKALRGPAADYKDLTATMAVVIGGETLEIHRGKKESVTTAAGTIAAVGAEAVNQYLTRAMGFPLEVFDVVCSSSQKDSERFTRLRPAERKHMIDDIVGLGKNEAIEKSCREEAKQLKRDADTLRGTVVEAVMPVQPDSYQDLKILSTELREAKAVEHRRSELLVTISRVGPEPEAPATKTPTEEELAALQDYETDRMLALATHARMKTMASGIPDATYTAGELDSAEEWLDYEAEWKRRGPPPTMDVATVENYLESWMHYNSLKDQERHEATCPKCDHKFRTGVEIGDPPEVSSQVLRVEQIANLNWAIPLIMPTGATILLGRHNIVEGRKALALHDEKQKMLAEVAAFAEPEDRSAELKQMQYLQAQWSAWSASMSLWTLRSDAATQAGAELKALPAPVDVDALQEAYTEARIFETQFDNYLKAKAREDELIIQIAAKLEKAESFKAGGDALQRARASFKAYLAPSFSRVASSLISQMTNGVMNSVVIDEEMNIAIDGQSVETLSGAGETVANMALRLALGNILVAKVFPVFIGDEIDAYADDERTAATAEALSNLKNQFKQIILISHKTIDFADHYINLDKTPRLLSA